MNPVVLLVDDEQSICSALKRTFKQHHYQVFAANSGEEALELLQKNAIDVVVSDQRMPGMKGTELLSIVRNRYPRIGRVILSGHSDVNDLAEAINEANIFRFIPKPWDEEQLLRIVNHAAAKPQTAGASIVPLQNHHTPRPPAPVINIDQAFTQKQMDLEKAIHNDQLSIELLPVRNEQDPYDVLHYLSIHWPQFRRFQHEGIINISEQSGYINDLFAWYLINACDWVDMQHTQTPLILDIFTCAAIRNSSLRSLLRSFLQKAPHPILRIPYEALQEQFFSDLLMDIYQSNASLLLNIGKRVIDISELSSTPLKYLEMDGKPTAINNGLLTEKRLKMLADAQNYQIKTILMGVDQDLQYEYASSMGFDFF